MFIQRSFYFLRHGETHYNATRIIAGGNRDIPLNDRGREQARDVRDRVASLPLTSICVSPLSRAKETMRLAAADTACNCFEIEELRECSADIWLAMAKTGTSAPSCFQIKKFFMQVSLGINKCLTKPAPVLIIAHGGVYWSLCHQMGIEDTKWKINNCELVEFIPKEDCKWEVVRCGQTSLPQSPYALGMND